MPEVQIAEDQDIRPIQGLDIDTDTQNAALQQLIEAHRAWATRKAGEIIDSQGGVFDAITFATTLEARHDVSQVIGLFGFSAHTALHELLMKEGQAYAGRIAIA
ncbi:MAG: hypothetical protein Q8P68_02910 [Candidatus Peregrinibacteria bacterium]|nr:hypothetical protein [Candidatus Peregrinibacteria bacterium]MDZ4245482.1 hypothetical protein [Candidatus Gracilibacteria bacterium]